jgi:hypothetical protein
MSYTVNTARTTASKSMDCLTQELMNRDDMVPSLGLLTSVRFYNEGGGQQYLMTPSDYRIPDNPFNKADEGEYLKFYQFWSGFNSFTAIRTMNDNVLSILESGVLTLEKVINMCPYPPVMTGREWDMVKDSLIKLELVTDEDMKERGLYARFNELYLITIDCEQLKRGLTRKLNYLFTRVLAFPLFIHYSLSPITKEVEELDTVTDDMEELEENEVKVMELSSVAVAPASDTNTDVSEVEKEVITDAV